MRSVIHLTSLVSIIAFMLEGCSVSPIKRSDATDQVISKVNLSLVRFSSPEYDPARPDEFEQKNRELNCQSPNPWWGARLKTEQVLKMIECVNSLDSGVAHYLYQSSGRIFLKLDPHEEHQPTCLKDALSEIPLPREIYFYGLKKDATEQDSYAASFNVNTNQILDAELRQARVGIDVRFPLSRKLKDQNDLQLWLTTLVFSLLKSEGELKASIVTELTTDRCFKGDPLFQDKKKGKLPPVFWP